MDFSLSDDQELLRDTARALVREHCPSSLVRAYVDEPSVADPLNSRLQEFVELAAGPTVDLCLFLEELGAALVPGTFVPTVALFAPFADGDTSRTGSIAVRSPFEMPAIEGDRVDLVAVIDGDSVEIVERPDGKVLEPFDLSRRLYQPSVRLSGRDRGASLALEPLAVRDAPMSGALERGMVALSAELMGAVRWMFETTLEYVKTREQFDRPIGSFQALQHRLADMSLLYERAWASVYWAAMAIDADDDERHRAVHVAKSSASEAARHIALEAMQMHGGIGFTWDHDLHLYIRRAFATEELLGTTAWHRDRLGELVL
jgi:alkylation response protein AidB-like acyl-CoA dehydrogenase